MMKRNANPLIAAVILAALLCGVPSAFAQGLYRHVDDRGRVTYSDVPPDTNAKAVKQAAPNVTSKEAVRQLEMAKRDQQQREAEERQAALRRAAAARKPEPIPQPTAIPYRRGGYDPTQPPAQSAGDSSRHY